MTDTNTNPEVTCPKIGDRIRLKKDIYEPTDDYAMGGYLALKGEILIVRGLREKGTLAVSHENTTNCAFLCFDEEYEVVT